MIIKKSLYIAIAIVPFIIGTLGCAPLNHYGRLSTGPWGGHSMTIEKLYENWGNYYVYYSGVNKGLLGGIMFDPRDDGRKLVGHEWWTKVRDRELLSELLIWISFHPYQTRLYKILGPDNELYGYLYSMRSDVLIKKIDDKTLWIDELVLPPIVVELEGGSG